MKTFDLNLEGDKIVSLRLTSQALSKYIKEHGIPGAAPVVSVLNAVNDLDALMALLTAAMRYKGAVADKDIPTGGELLDLLADEDRGDLYVRGLVVRLALDAGLLDEAGAHELEEAMAANSALVVSKVAQLLRLDGGDAPAQEEGANPT